MQLSFSLTPESLTDFETAISSARLDRFLDGGNCRHKATRMYVWNARLCEELYLPLQTAEVAIRNSIAATLTRRFSANWHSSPSVLNQLTPKYQDHLKDVISREKARKKAAFTTDQVVSGLSFGFWANLMTSRYKNWIWQQGVNRTFLHAPANLSLTDAHKKVDQLRRFRNMVAHHYAIFDQSPVREYANLLEIVSWISPTSVWFVKEMSNPAKIISQKPKV